MWGRKSAQPRKASSAALGNFPVVGNARNVCDVALTQADFFSASAPRQSTCPAHGVWPRPVVPSRKALRGAAPIFLSQAKEVGPTSAGRVQLTTPPLFYTASCVLARRPTAFSKAHLHRKKAAHNPLNHRVQARLVPPGLPFQPSFHPTAKRVRTNSSSPAVTPGPHFQGRRI